MASYDTIVTRGAGGESERPPSRAVMLTFGAVAFEAPGSSYARLRRRSAWRWPSQDRTGRRPAYQFTGPGPENVELEGVIFPLYAGGALPDALRALAATGEPRELTSGAGDGTVNVFGLWVLTEVEDLRTRPYRDGAPRRIEWRLSLARYGDDAPTGRLTALESAVADVGDVRAVLDAAERAVRAGQTPAQVLAAAQAAAEAGR